MTEDLLDQPFIDQQLDWLKAHMVANKLTGADAARAVNVPNGTLSQILNGSYTGAAKRSAEVARQIEEYRLLLDQQASFEAVIPDVPGFFAAPTSNAIKTQLIYAHRGNMIAIVAVPGSSKSMTIAHYQQLHRSTVHVITVRPSGGGLANMLLETLKVLGKRDEVGSPQRLSNLIIDLVRQRNILLIYDEAQNLTDPAMEEIRGWYDVAEIGVAFVGEPKLAQRIKATGKAAKPALQSRTNIFQITKVKQGDVAALCAAWESTAPEELRLMREIASLDGALRTCTKVFELASIIAAGREEKRGLTHLLTACQQRSLDVRSPDADR